MTEKFLRAKHWQLFIFIFAIPFTLQWIFMSILYIKNNPDLVYKLMPLCMIIFGFGFVAWFWSIATGLQSIIPPEIKMKTKKFKVLLCIPLIYIPIAFNVMDLMPQGNFEVGDGKNGGLYVLIIIAMIILHMISMFGILYSIYFVAKTFKTAELQRETRFADFAGELFLIYFFPIGIWVVQPKINKMTNNYANKK